MPSVRDRPAAPPDRRRRRIPTSAERVGHLVAAAMNGVMLWAVHQLLDRQWPGFLTDDFQLVLGIVTASLIAGIAVNLGLAAHHRGRVHPLADLVTGAFGLAVGLQMWAVFPFDFTGYATDWSGFVHVAIIVGLGVTGIAMIANLVKLVIGPPDET